jgi:DNA-binding transcriptional LysR family regulator
VLEPEAGPAGGTVLAQARLLILCAPAHPLARRGVTPDDLTPCDFCMGDASGNYHQALRHLFDRAQLPAPRMHVIGTIEGVKRAILAEGTALGLLPEHAVEPELREGVLAEVRVRPALPSVMLRAVLAPGALRSAVVDDLLDSLRGAPGSGQRLTAAVEAVREVPRARTP